MAVPGIVEVFPTDGYTQFPVGGSLTVLFDSEVDEYTARRAIFVYGPDYDTFVGPGMNVRLGNGYNPYENTLRSPGYNGDVLVDIVVEKVDSNGDVLTTPTYEVADLERTRVTLTPCQMLAERTEYCLFVAGDSSISNAISISSRSVFDAEAAVGNTGDGEVISSGVYGLEDPCPADTLVIAMTTGGDNLNARFDWWLLSNPVDVHTHRAVPGLMELLPNVFIEIPGNGSFDVGDQFSIKLEPTELLENTIKFTFSTALDHVIDPPSTISTSPLGVGTTPSVTEFAVTKCSPRDESSNVNINSNQIIITFSKDIDPASITHETVQLIMRSVRGGVESNVPHSYLIAGNKLVLNIMEH